MKKFGLVLLLFLSSCSTPQKKLDYSDFQNRTIEWNNLFDQYQTEYEVYIYSTYCLYCYEIKDDILNYGYHKENFFLIIYNDIYDTIDNRGNKSNAKVSYDKKTEYKVGNSKKIYVYKNKKLVKVVTGVKRTAELYNVSVSTLSRNLNKWSYLDYNGYRFSYKELY